MLKRILSIAVFTALTFMANGQAYRTIDGSGNNLSNPNWGSIGEQLTRITSHAYADGISAPGGNGLPNPRVISNALFAQDSSLLDQLNLSDFVWVFGQFTDHDMISTSNDPTESASIHIDFEDEYFNPGGIFPNVQIHMSRSQEMAGTGTDINNPREHGNNLTAWLDASNVYGSDTDRAVWLRSFVDGKLKISAGNLLPYNTIDGELNSPIDPNAPGMDNENPFVTKLAIAGDTRANENTLLTCLHTVFVREHNRYCDELKGLNPTWDDTQLYRESRRRVNAHIQAITYEEWLPAMGIELASYSGYNPTANPNISNIFAAAAFRLGHTLLNGNLRTVDNNGNYLGDIALKDAFFTPSLVADMGLDPFFKGMAEQIEQEMDGKVVDDVRNFLFGPPTSGVGGLDLAAININRGRERGIPPFNTARTDLGLTAYTDLNDFSSDPIIVDILAAQYGNVNNIDPWVGMLLEEHMPGALFGEVIMHIMMDQFGAVRDGDRFYYENDNSLGGEIETIKNTTFRDIIMRNTEVTIMQENVFEAMPHDSICMADGPLSEINGAIQTWNGLNIEGVETIATDVSDNSTVTANTTANGAFLLEGATSCAHYVVTPTKNTNHLNGVTTNDLIKTIRHILEVQLLDSPYKIIAADANNNGEVTIGDVLAIRKLILFIDTEFESSNSWRFVDADYIFDDPTQPLGENFPESKDVDSAGDLLENLNFVAIKVGDINGSANPDLFGPNESEVKTDETLSFEIADREFKSGEIIQVPVRSSEINEMGGFQFTLQVDPSALAFDVVYAQSLPSLSASNFTYLEKEGQLLASWNGDARSLLGTEVLFTLQFEATKNGRLSDFISINSTKVSAEAYSLSNIDEVRSVDLRFGEKEAELGNEFTLLQNQPNPFRNNSLIGFNLPGDSEVIFTINDVTGRLIYKNTTSFEKGFQQIEVDPSMVAGGGSVLYYKVETAFGTATRKMTLVR
jgi:hypothetical protein